jgi:hypothetical protein
MEFEGVKGTCAHDRRWCDAPLRLICSCDFFVALLTSRSRQRFLNLHRESMLVVVGAMYGLACCCFVVSLVFGLKDPREMHDWMLQ